MKQDYKGLFGDEEVAVAKHLVKEFRETRSCLRRDDAEDLLQECLIHWLSIRDGYDPARGASHNTFMGRVVRNKLRDFIREREADKRKLTYTAVSLSQPSADDEDSAISEVKLADERPSGYSQVSLRMDLTEALRKLTPKQRKLCHLLKDDGLNIKEVSQCLDTPRSTIYDELKRIRKIFLKEGLDEYLE